MISTNSFRKLKPLIFLAIIAPSFVWLFQLINGSLGVNPIEKLMDNLGEMGLRLIIATLIISSLSEFKKLRFLVDIRRMIGLFAFFYVACHFLTYIALDHFFDISFIIRYNQTTFHYLWFFKLCFTHSTGRYFSKKNAKKIRL